MGFTHVKSVITSVNIYLLRDKVTTYPQLEAVIRMSPRSTQEMHGLTELPFPVFPLLPGRDNLVAIKI